MSCQIALDTVNLKSCKRLAHTEKEMDQTLALASDCSGLIWAVGNHIPYNVPIETAEKYIDYLKAHRNRK